MCPMGALRTFRDAAFVAHPLCRFAPHKNPVSLCIPHMNCLHHNCFLCVLRRFLYIHDLVVSNDHNILQIVTTDLQANFMIRMGFV